MNSLPQLNQQRGFGAVMAIIVLVILASLAAAMTRFGSIQHMTSAQDVLAVRAQAAARSGIEYGLYQALRNSPPACEISQLDLTTDTGFHVTVVCKRSPTAPALFHEGEKINLAGTATEPRTLTVYTITATACNIPTATPSCPNATAVASPGYVERVVETIATDTAPD